MYTDIHACSFCYDNTTCVAKCKPHINFVEGSQHCASILCIFKPLCYTLSHPIHFNLNTNRNSTNSYLSELIFSRLLTQTELVVYIPTQHIIGHFRGQCLPATQPKQQRQSTEEQNGRTRYKGQISIKKLTFFPLPFRAIIFISI